MHDGTQTLRPPYVADAKTHLGTDAGARRGSYRARADVPTDDNNCGAHRARRNIDTDAVANYLGANQGSDHCGAY